MVTKERRKVDPKHRTLVSLVLSIGLLLCLVNALYLVQMVDIPLQNIARKQTPTIGKERLLNMLYDAGIHNISQEEIEQLPTWNEVVHLYGNQPKIVGLETCQTFQQSIPATKRLIAPAGVFNSGTNLLAELLLKNCVLEDRMKRYKKGTGVRWQVNWGKHQPPRFRLTHNVDTRIKNNTIMMPVVMVRDPYSWMQSMCRHRYSAHWFHPPNHCPNLISNDQDLKFFQYAPHYKRKRFQKYHGNDPWLMDNVHNTANFLPNMTIIPLYVRYKLTNTTHTSLAHLWNDWYTDYVKGDFPRIFVRMEDLVFHAKSVVTDVCHCVGGTLSSKFHYIAESAKHGTIHGNDKTSLLDAMIRYGSLSKLNRTKGMTQQDVAYAKQVFNSDLMNLFGYSYP